MIRPERLIEIIEADYAIYADLCEESDRTASPTTSDEAWIEQALTRLVESATQPWLNETWKPPIVLRLMEPIAQEPDAVISPPAAQRWLSEEWRHQTAGAKSPSRQATLEWRDEQWMEHVVAKLLEPLTQESEAVILPPAAQQWIDELPGLLSRRQAEIRE